MRSKFHIGPLFLILQAGAALGSEPSCAPLPIPALHPQEVRGYIRGPGRYCLQQDITAVSRFDIHAGSFKSFSGQGLISIECDRDKACAQKAYSIDLQSRRLLAKTTDMVGITNRSGGMNVAIRNGRIEVPGKSSSNIGISLRWLYTPFAVEGKKCLLEDPKCQDIPASQTDAKKAPDYQPGGYLIDNVNIRAGWRGVQMGGGGNVLRNSVIEVDSSTAVVLFGPGVIIENNTIIIHGKGEQGDFDAALKLRDGHGAVVRNNTFIYRRGLFSGARTAIKLLDTSDVLIEGNTFDGFEQSVRMWGATTYTIK